MLVNLAAARLERVGATRRLGWTEDERAMRLNYGLYGPPGTFDAACSLAEHMAEPTRAAALELLEQTRRRSEEYLSTASSQLDAIGWRFFTGEVANAFETADRTIAAARRILREEDALSERPEVVERR